MVVTKLLVRDAGNARNIPRRRFLLGVGAGLACAVGETIAASPGVIVPTRSITGARLLQRVNPSGMPENRPDSFGPMTLFVFPVALAATSMDLYIADPGLGALLRYDPMLDSMAPIRGARVTQLSRLAAMPDGSVVLSNGGMIPSIRFSRSGRPFQSLDPQLGSAYYDEVVADPNSGRFYGFDRVQGRLEELMPHGRGATVLPFGVMPDQPTAIAMDNKFLYVASMACGCVEAIDLFGGREKFTVAADFGKITALAASDGWLVVADSIEMQIRIYRDGVLRADPSFSDLRLLNPQGMAIVNNQLYVADPGGRRVATFRLRP